MLFVEYFLFLASRFISISSVALGESLCHPNWEMFCSGWGLKGFSLICSDVGVEPKYSEGMFDVCCCTGVCGVL